MDTIKALFIEDNADYAQLVRFYLSRMKTPSFDVTWVDSLQKGLEVLLKDESFNIILTDLFLPDSSGIDTFTVLQKQYGHIPIVVITAYDDEKVAVQAVKDGAQDYLVKGDITGKMIARVLLYAFERQKMRAELNSLSLTDELTKLRNRRGFLTLAEQHVKLCQRTKRGFILIVADLDHLKKINDQFGHSAGDQALMMAANVLTETFRQSDIIARMGGDEFAILAIDAEHTKGADILKRLQKNLSEKNKKQQWPFFVSMSTGIAAALPGEPIDLNQLIEEADKVLYQHKYARTSKE